MYQGLRLYSNIYFTFFFSSRLYSNIVIHVDWNGQEWFPFDYGLHLVVRVLMESCS